MSDYRYILEKYNGKNRYECPGCGKRNQFSRYMDTATGEHIGPNIGKCNRELKCTYHYTPRQYFEDNNIDRGSVSVSLALRERKQETAIKPSFIDPKVFSNSLRGYDGNNFILFLIGLFGPSVTSNLISGYFIGTSKKWPCSTVFWQIDANGKIRTGKIMQYDPNTGKRIKTPTDRITWVHSELKLNPFNLSQCLFGEHLLTQSRKPAAIVESEKTALIASVYLPQFVWLAVGGKEGLNIEKCRKLIDRKVVLFPDLKAFDYWSGKANELKSITTVEVSDLLEVNATPEERENGLDLADYLLRFNPSQFEYKAPQSEAFQSTPIPQTEPRREFVEEAHIVKRVFGWMDCKELSTRELINGIIYEKRKFLSINQRLELHSETDIENASELIEILTKAGILSSYSNLFELARN